MGKLRACINECRTEDNRFLGLALSKKLHGEHWRRLFRGDPDGARCMLPPYRLSGAPLKPLFFALHISRA